MRGPTKEDLVRLAPIARCYLPLVVSLAFLLSVRGDAWDYADDEYPKTLYTYDVNPASTAKAAALQAQHELQVADQRRAAAAYQASEATSSTAPGRGSTAIVQPRERLPNPAPVQVVEMGSDKTPAGGLPAEPEPIPMSAAPKPAPGATFPAVTDVRAAVRAAGDALMSLAAAPQEGLAPAGTGVDVRAAAKAAGSTILSPGAQAPQDLVKGIRVSVLDADEAEWEAAAKQAAQRQDPLQAAAGSALQELRERLGGPAGGAGGAQGSRGVRADEADWEAAARQVTQTAPAGQNPLQAATGSALEQLRDRLAGPGGAGAAHVSGGSGAEEGEWEAAARQVAQAAPAGQNPLQAAAGSALQELRDRLDGPAGGAAGAGATRGSGGLGAAAQAALSGLPGAMGSGLLPAQGLPDLPSLPRNALPSLPGNNPSLMASSFQALQGLDSTLGTLASPRTQGLGSALASAGTHRPFQTLPAATSSQTLPARDTSLSQPARDSSQPARDSSQPAQDSTSASLSATSSLPARDSSQPARDSSQPARDSTSASLSATSSQPARDSSQPAPDSSQPARDSTSASLSATSSLPATTTTPLAASSTPALRSDPSASASAVQEQRPVQDAAASGSWPLQAGQSQPSTWAGSLTQGQASISSAAWPVQARAGDGAAAQGTLPAGPRGPGDWSSHLLGNMRSLVVDGPTVALPRLLGYQQGQRSVPAEGTVGGTGPERGAPPSQLAGLGPSKRMAAGLAAVPTPNSEEAGEAGHPGMDTNAAAPSVASLLQGAQTPARMERLSQERVRLASDVAFGEALLGKDARQGGRDPTADAARSHQLEQKVKYNANLLKLTEAGMAQLTGHATQAQP